MSEINELLAGLGLTKYQSAFAEAEVEFGDLPHLTDDDLKEVGLPVGPRRRLVEAIKTLNTQSSPYQQSAGFGPQTGQSSGAATTVSSSDAERRHLTVMFVDLVGSTELATKIDPEDMRAVITNYQNIVAGIVPRFDGFVAKFMGDGVLCYFGWPRANEDDAERAVRAGLAMIDAVKQTSAPDGTPLATRVGLATGVVIVGDLIGSGATQEAAVVGETPNLAARLQGVAQPNQLILPRETQSLLGDIFDLQSIGSTDLKGISNPVEAFVVTGENTRESRFAARHSGALTEIVGRNCEIELIVERWQQVRTNFGQMVVVGGEAGIGKSRITQAVIEEIAENRPARITYQCSPYHTDSAFHPVIQQLTREAGFLPSDAPDVRLGKLEVLLGQSQQVMTPIASILGLGEPDPDLTPAQQRAQIMDSLTEAILKKAEANPVLLVFEDLHWIDPTSLELLELLLDAITDQPVMILATARPTFDYTFAGNPLVTRFSLNRLSKDQVDEIVLKQTNGKSLPDKVMEIIASRTDGVPLFVEELTKTILESSIVKETDNRFVLDGPLSSVSIPTTLHDSLMARLDKLPPIKELAQTAACIGREFDHQLVSKISPLPGAELLKGLEGLTEAELIYRRGLPPRATYIFKHALVRDTAYESLLKEKRRKVHASIFAALEADTETAPELLALHAENAKMDREAAKYWRLAAVTSVSQSANAEALNQFERALLALQRQPDELHRANLELQVRTDMTGPLVAAEGYGSTKLEENFTRALALSEQTGEIGGIFPILYGRAVFHVVTARLPLAVALAEEILDVANRQDHIEPTMLGHRMVGLAKLFSGDTIAALEHLEKVSSIDLPESKRSAPYLYGQDIEAAAQCLYSLALAHRGYPEQAIEMAKKAVQRARQLNHPHTLAYTAAFASFGFSDWRSIENVKWCLDEIELVIGDNPDIQLWPIMRDYLEFRYLALSGNHKQSLPYAEKFVSGMKSARFYVMLPGAIAEQAETLLELGEVDAALERTEEAFNMAQSAGEDWQLSRIVRVRARAELLLGNKADTENSLLESISLAKAACSASSELFTSIQYAEFLRDKGDPKKAERVLSPIYQRFSEGQELPAMNEARALLDELSLSKT
ncbi:MAG: adenylate/guanylate cyclase domain-containing protein [Rhizobiaceae bacterium]